MEVFVVFRQAAATAEPAECPLDNPAFGQHDKPRLVAAFDDFEWQSGGVTDCIGGRLSLIPAVGKNGQQFGMAPFGDRHHRRDGVAILDVGRRDHEVDDETLRVDRDMTLLALDFLAPVVP